MASSWNEVDDSAYDVIEPEVSAVTEDQKYIEASNVNLNNCISEKLSGHTNYPIWRNQMIYLIQSWGLLHIIEAEYPSPGMSQYDKLVKSWILSTMFEDLFYRFVHFNSARELWMELESVFNQPISNGEEFRSPNVLLSDTPEMENTRERLHEAAVDGCWWKAKSILTVHEKAATQVINGNGSTMLHLAVEMRHNYFVEKLLEFIKDGKDIETQNYKGRTALHIAALVGNTPAARLLVQKRKELLVILDYNQVFPWRMANDSFKTNTAAYLLKSALSSNLNCFPDDYQESAAHAIGVSLFTKNYGLTKTLLKKFPEAAYNNHIILFVLVITFPTDLGFMESFIYPSYHNVLKKIVARGSLPFHSNFWDKCVDDILQLVKICNNTYCSWLGKNSRILLVAISTLYPIYQLICLLILVLRLPFSMLYFHLWKALAVTVPPIKNIERKKRDYQRAKNILSLICNQMGPSNYGFSVSILRAVVQGTYEVVDEILSTSPATINCRNEDNHSIIQLAIINRSEKIYNLIYHIIERTQACRKMTDSSMNNLAHLAGRLAPSSVLSRTTGAALQLQRELKWREEVEKLMFPIELMATNSDKETPAMVFTREHQDLLKEGESWMKTTAESCSITAALIVTIVFAAAITVPGGNNEGGTPLFNKKSAFTIFALSNAFSLFTSATSLLLFLSILTARFSEKDFLVSLPRRLIFGLLMLFLSTTAMIIAFGAILFLVFCDQRPWMLAPICVFACLPISVIVTVKVPLLVDLIQSTYFPLFGNQSYLEPCKVNRKNTTYRD